MSRIVVVGGSLGGLRATEALLARGWEGEIVVLSAERHPPYTRPPLSKALLAGTPDLSAVELRRRPETDAASWRFGVSAVRADLRARHLTLSDGSELPYDGLVAATGVRPRRLPERVTRNGFTLRTLDDCIALRPLLSPGTRLAIVGAGFIGCEIAATAAGFGCAVDVVALDTAPMKVPLGELVGTAIQRRHEAHGVRFHLGRSIRAVESSPSGHALLLDDGSRVECDVFVQAVGSAPCVEWLEGNGLDLTDGVECDNSLRMGGLPGAVAVGDVARFPNPLFDNVARRVEHWQMAAETAARAAATLLADLSGTTDESGPFRPLPWFWSDQFEMKLQSFGSPVLGERVEVLDGDLAGEAAVGYYRGERLVGAVLLGMPKAAFRLRKQILASLASDALEPA
ncbi:UNVERIFIED_ORG: NADPH-dependent 2,4-dienoyl-CoA reductase/sulfur reductase-like enzyme [Microbispora rosea subsp. rosea]